MPFRPRDDKTFQVNKNVIYHNNHRVNHSDEDIQWRSGVNSIIRAASKGMHSRVLFNSGQNWELQFSALPVTIFNGKTLDRHFHMFQYAKVHPPEQGLFQSQTQNVFQGLRAQSQRCEKALKLTIQPGDLVPKNNSTHIHIHRHMHRQKHTHSNRKRHTHRYRDRLSQTHKHSIQELSKSRGQKIGRKKVRTPACISVTATSRDTICTRRATKHLSSAGI